MTIIATAPVPGSIDRGDTDVLPTLPADLDPQIVDLVARIDAKVRAGALSDTDLNLLTAAAHGTDPRTADLIARIERGPFAGPPLPTCPSWCAEHMDASTWDGFGDGAWHVGRKYQTARVFTGARDVVDGQVTAETEPVWVRAETYTGPHALNDEEPGVYVSELGKLSIEAAMDLAADLIRCASELVAAEVAKARGGSR
jgi:hypothetical protein